MVFTGGRYPARQGISAGGFELRGAGGSGVAVAVREDFGVNNGGAEGDEQAANRALVIQIRAIRLFMSSSTKPVWQRGSYHVEDLLVYPGRA